MTRHLRSIYHFTTSTKENKVKPTEHTAKAAVTPKIGRFATLRGLRQTQGSGAHARGLIATAFSLTTLCALCVLLALCVGVAQAAPPSLISYGNFSDPGHPLGIAIEQSSGDVYTAGLIGAGASGFTQEHIYKHHASGKVISPPSPFGESFFSGVAVNPTNGDVYALGEAGFFAPAKLNTYDPNSGALLSSFEVTPSRNYFGVFTILQIGVDSAGNVYVPVVPENKVLEYSSAGTLLNTFTGSGTLAGPVAVAVDSSGDLWVGDLGHQRIEELSPSDAPVAEIESEGVQSVALDGHGHVFSVVDNRRDSCGSIEPPCDHMMEYSLTGAQLADVGAASFGGHAMVAANESSGRVYVSDGENTRVWVFGPPTAPLVENELTDEVTTSEAKLGALVNPGGIQTAYRFEYGPTSAYGSSTPFPEGSVGEGVTSRAVWAAASGLAAGTTYHYRVVATNELGTVAGPDQTFTTELAVQAECANEQLRGGYSARLPDCRAYELVTPPVKSSSQFDPETNGYSSTAAADGEALTLFTTEPRPGAPTAGELYVATRGAGGWIAEDIMPIESYDSVTCPGYQHVYAYSEQLTKDVMQVDGGSRASASGNTREDPESCNPEGSQVVSGEPVGYENLLVRDNATGAYQLVNVTPPGVTPADAHFHAASADLSHVIFTETSPLAEGARYGVENLYEWEEGAPRLVSVLPDGTAVPGALAAEAGTPAYEGVISGDGSRVLFTYGGALYDRIDGQRTVQVDEQQGGPGASDGGSLQAATVDGSKVFFLDESKLTAGSTAQAGEPDLYECALPEGASKCDLTDLTVAAAGGHADVLGVTPLGRHDSSYVYFIAKGVLASNTREFTNSEGETVVEGAQAGKQNLYLWDGEKTTFIATGIYYGGRFGGGRTSPDGKWLSFQSYESLTGYNNVESTGANAGQSARELFLYSAATGELVCASCNPTGEDPVGALLRGEALVEGGGMVLHSEDSADRRRRLLTDAGQAFFETTDALVPSDTNGQLDVYEYEGGQVHLITSGTSPAPSTLEDASESGDDVFFRSTQQLVPQDNQEGQIVIYDARIGGGFPAPASPPACTTADACRTPTSAQPSIYGAPASQTFSGVGNLAPSSEVNPKKRAKPRKKVCKRTKRKRARCATRASWARTKAKSNKGGK